MNLEHESSDATRERIAVLEEALRSRTFELDVLYELSAKLGADLTYEQLALIILTHLDQVLRYDVAASLLIASDDHCDLFLHAVGLLSPAAQFELEARLTDACSRLLRTAVRREDLRTVRVGGPASDGPAIDRLGSFFQVPIIVDRRPVGLIFVGAAAENQFDEQHLRLLYTVANQASASVQSLQAFQEAERRRLTTVVRHLPEGVVLLDANRRVLLANPVGQHYLDSLTERGPDEVLLRVGDRPFEELACSGAVLLRTPHPTPRTITATTIRLDHDLPECWLLVFRDETEVREAVRRRDEFLAMLGHELRNPLGAVTSATEILQRPDLTDRNRELAIDVLIRQFRHLKRLVNDLLDASRFLHGKVRVEKKRMDLAALVDRTVRAHLPEFALEGKRLEAVGTTNPLPVEGDEVRLRQVLDNLLNNARKFTSAGERTQIECARIGNEAIVLVRDDGEGISAERLASIFEPFVQDQNTLDRSRGGLGLGLYTVKTLAEMHGGSVSAHSDGHGLGSTFTLRLPSCSPHIDEEPSASPPRPSRKRVLVVEDEADVRAMLRTLLALSGHEVEVAENGPEAIAAFQTYRPDIGFIDLGLPGLDGFQVAEALRDDPHRPSARLIALSGYAQPVDVERSRRAGFDHHLAKPVQLADLQPFLADD